MGDRTLPSFKCSVTMTVMQDPVSTVDGQTYERSAIQRLFDNGHVTSPLTGLMLEKNGALDLSLVSNLALRSATEQWAAAELASRQEVDAAEWASRWEVERNREEGQCLRIAMATQILQFRGEASGAAEAVAEVERWRKKGKLRQREALESRGAERSAALQEVRSQGMFERDIDELRERSVRIEDKATTRMSVHAADARSSPARSHQRCEASDIGWCRCVEARSIWMVMYLHCSYEGAPRRCEASGGEGGQRAAQHGHLDVVKCLAEKRGEELLMTMHKDSESCLFVAAQKGHLDIVKHLAEKGEKELLMLTDTHGPSCLNIAARKGHLDVVKHLAEKGGKELLMLKEEEGWSCLLIAAQYGCLDVAKHLAEKGGRELLMLTHEDEASCLFVAAQQGQLNLVKHLAEQGGEELLMLTDETGFSCLHIAAQQGHLDVVEHLAEKGGRELLMLTEEEGWSCLHIAAHCAQDGPFAIVKHLAERGWRELVVCLTNAGKTARDLAAEQGHEAIAHFLVLASVEGSIQHRRLSGSF